MIITALFFEKKWTNDTFSPKSILKSSCRCSDYLKCVWPLRWFCVKNQHHGPTTSLWRFNVDYVLLAPIFVLIAFCKNANFYLQFTKSAMDESVMHKNVVVSMLRVLKQQFVSWYSFYFLVYQIFFHLQNQVHQFLSLTLEWLPHLDEYSWQKNMFEDMVLITDRKIGKPVKTFIGIVFNNFRSFFFNLVCQLNGD